MYRRSLRSLREELGRDSNPDLPDDQEGHIATPHSFLFLKSNCVFFEGNWQNACWGMATLRKNLVWKIK